MAKENTPSPASYKGVMVSSTFTDLELHRAELMKALRREKLVAIGMEDYVVQPDDDVISSSLNMVRESSAYIGLISRRYGQVPECAERNPQAHSITRLEFEEAQRLGLPTLVFVMGAKHSIEEADVELDPKNREKLEGFRARAKEGRIYVDFESLEKFTKEAIHAVANLRRYLEEQAEPSAPQLEAAPLAPDATQGEPDPIPSPPAFYAEPAYIGSHEFVGRRSQLETLSDWAAPADAHPVLLFEAIGGAGKSLLTWEWTTKHATDVRDDWAGRFWYSFYERGAVMADFCRRALAYITGRPLEDFRKKKTLELGEQLLHHLQERPWLLILDGLERVLVAYQRIDAAQLRDEEADAPTDQIAHRDPCAAIRPEDDDLLRALAGASPSKLLLTSRLIPRVLLNPASQPIPGVLRERLPGLRPADAEALLRNCDVTGDSQNIQRYLKSHCDCHPLVTGVLAGLINDYLPDRGSFDAWVADPDAGGGLNFAQLDLVQKRNHILAAALDALSPEGRQLLSTLSLLSEAVDFATLSAFNPHLPPEPEEVPEPEKPEGRWRWRRMPDEQKEQAKVKYEAARRRRKEFLQALRDREQSPEFRAAPRKLVETVRDLEQRGLLQYDAQTKRHDLHPVVRSVAVGNLRQEEKERFGQRVVDHFSQQVHSPYEEAETLEDVRDGLHVVRTLLQMGRHQEACDAYSGDLARALTINLEAHAEMLSLLRPFFPHGWAALPDDLDAFDGGYLTNDAGVALQKTGEPEEALVARNVHLQVRLQNAEWHNVRAGLSNISELLRSENHLASEDRCLVLSLELVAQLNNEEELFRVRLDRFTQLVVLGNWNEAEAMWQLLDPMGRDWHRAVYRAGGAESYYAMFRFWQGQLTEEHLAKAEQLAKKGKDRVLVRSLHGLRGAWQLEQGRYELAAASLQEAVRMAREVGQTNATAETQLAIARFHLDQLPDSRETAEQLAQAKRPFDRGLAELWHAIGDLDQAKHHALAAYKWAWADGEPYVHRYELDRCRALLEQLGEEIPDLPAYDPAKYEKFPWEDDLVAAIEKLRAKKEAKQAAEESEKE